MLIQLGENPAGLPALLKETDPTELMCALFSATFAPRGLRRRPGPGLSGRGPRGRDGTEEAQARQGIRFPAATPREALDFLDAKELRVGFDHWDVAEMEHAVSFTVAKIVQMDILDDIQVALSGHPGEGGTLRTLQQPLTSVLKEKGW